MGSKEGNNSIMFHLVSGTYTNHLWLDILSFETSGMAALPFGPYLLNRLKIFQITKFWLLFASLFFNLSLFSTFVLLSCIKHGLRLLHSWLCLRVILFSFIPSLSLSVQDSSVSIGIKLSKHCLSLMQFMRVQVTRQEGILHIFPRYLHFYFWLLLRWLIGYVSHTPNLFANDCPASILVFSPEHAFTFFVLWIGWEFSKSASTGSYLLVYS